MNNNPKRSTRGWGAVLLSAALLAFHAAHAAVLTGAISAIGAPNITVGTTTVTTTPQTVVSQACASLSFADLTAGDIVTVEGTLQADGSILASTISQGAGCIASGPIEALAADGIVVAGRGFQVDAGTIIQEGCATEALFALRVGEQVTVDGQVVNGGPPLALSITAAGSCTFSGVIAAIAGPQLTVAGRIVSVDGQTTITRGCSAVSIADLSVGDAVTVSADALADGTLLAHAIAVGACTAFEAFSARVEREEHRGFELAGTFRPGRGGNGIDPAHEALFLSVGAANVSLAAGSLRPHGTMEWRFEGAAGTMRVEVRLQLQRGSYAIQVEAMGADTGALGATVPVTLVIGDDRGQALARVDD